MARQRKRRVAFVAQAGCVGVALVAFLGVGAQTFQPSYVTAGGVTLADDCSDLAQQDEDEEAEQQQQDEDELLQELNDQSLQEDEQATQEAQQEAQVQNDLAEQQAQQDEQQAQLDEQEAQLDVPGN